MVVATTHEDLGIGAKKAQDLLDIGAEALIVSGITHNNGFDALIERTQLQAFATLYYVEGYYLPTIGYDNGAASRMALRFLYEYGHRNIGILCLSDVLDMGAPA